MADLKYNKELYFNELSHYFAIATAELFGKRISIMLKDDNFVHAFVEIMPNCFIDAKGIFTDISERSNFVFNDIMTISVTETQAFLKSQKIKYTDVAHKKCVREYLRNNMLTFDYFQNGYTYTMGICAITDFAGTECVLTYSYDMTKKVWGSYIHRIPLDAFVANIQKVYGFIPNKGWYYKK